MNLLVCTPGRLLQHMDESPGFDATNLLVRPELAGIRLRKGGHLGFRA